MDLESGVLPGPVANELGRALVIQVAQELGVPAIVIKGRALAYHRLEQPKVSADVDVLVRPSDFSKLVEELGKKGWAERPWSDPDGIFPQHSMTLLHQNWPIDIDVHVRFPGCEIPGEDLLEALLSTCEYVAEAGQAVPIPGRLETIVIAAVHLLRDASDLGALGRVMTFADEIAQSETATDVVDAARRLGALATAEPFLRQAFPASVPEDVGRPSDEWLRLSNTTHAGALRIEKLIQSRGRGVVGMVWRALYPSREALAASNLEAMAMSESQLQLMRWQRFRRALREAPIVLRDVCRYFQARRNHLKQ